MSYHNYIHLYKAVHPKGHVPLQTNVNTSRINYQYIHSRTHAVTQTHTYTHRETDPTAMVKTNEISSKKQNLSKKTLQRTGRISTETDTNININEKNPSKQTNDKSKFKEIKS